MNIHEQAPVQRTLSLGLDGSGFVQGPAQEDSAHSTDPDATLTLAPRRNNISEIHHIDDETRIRGLDKLDEVRRRMNPHSSDTELVETRVPWDERIEILQNNHGFLTTTIEEANIAFSGVLAFMDHPGGVGAHLNEILIHQKNIGTMTDPADAVRSVAQKMVIYCADAIMRREGLLSLYETLRDGIGPHVDVRAVEGLNHIGLLSVVQYAQAKKALATQSTSGFAGRIKKDEKSKRLFIDFDDITNDNITITEMISRLEDPYPSVKGVRDIALEAGRSQRARKDFWIEALRSASSHALAKPIVKKLVA